MITTLDVETTFQRDASRRSDPTPFHHDNYLVSVQYNTCSDNTPKFVWFNHDEKVPDAKMSHSQVQSVLDETKLLIGHNIKFDLVWLWESGFKYSNRVYDTMIGEYLLLRGQKWGVSLEESCKRRKVALKKTDLIDDYLAKGMGFNKMPPEVVEEYGCADILSTRELYDSQLELFKQSANSNMAKQLKLMNSFLYILAIIERNGIKINSDELLRVKRDYQIEKKQLESKMEEIMYEVMGDTRVNFASPEQLSQMIYSRKVTDKRKWAEVFNIGLNDKGKPLYRPKMSTAVFVNNVKTLTTRVHKTTANHCKSCKGIGNYQKMKKDGKPYKKLTKCSVCMGRGYTLDALPKIGGLTMNPRDIFDVSANGFATDKSTILRLLTVSRHKQNKNAEIFLGCVTRLNAVDVYLNSFVGGIERNTRLNGVLHPKYNQCVTRTTRLSSSDPNFQNQPRGNTFPVRAVVVSRFEGGKILQADYSQLEFRVAAQLCGDANMRKDILDGSDVHRYTASIIYNKREEDVTKDERTSAKAHTFKPLYGGTTGAPNETAYYKAFVNKYPKLGEWHENIQTEAISTGIVALYTGQQFAFPDTRRLGSGVASNAPAIKNYPVQGLAGGCIMPLALIKLQSEINRKKLRSLVINTVHDSVVVDVFPGEEDIVADVAYKSMTGVTDLFEHMYNVKWTIPLEVDIEIGDDWLNMKEKHISRLT